MSLFLALALCLTLLPAAAFADSESETSTPHTHYLCGNGETCSHLGGHNEDSKTTFATAITQNNDGYVWGGGDSTQNQPNQCVLSNGGTYYLASDLVLEAPLNAQFGCIQIDGNVTLCLNGHTITVKANREAFKITKSGSTSSSTLTLTDCQGGGKITHDPSFLGNSVNLSEDCNFIMYGGSITGNSVASSGGGVCVYGAMTVSGSVRITGNVNDGSKGDNGIYTDGTASNVCIVGSTTITINGPLTHMFWLRHIEEVQLYLKAWFPSENSYVFTAATFMGFDDNEHLPFLLMGDKHVLDGPLSKYSEIRSKMPAGKDAEILYEQIGVAAEDNLKLR